MVATMPKLGREGGEDEDAEDEEDLSEDALLACLIGLQDAHGKSLRFASWSSANNVLPPPLPPVAR